MPGNEAETRAYIKRLMTLCPPGHLSPEYYAAEEAFLREDRPRVGVEMIGDPLTKEIYLYKGDITHIQADAIVNAANEKLLGCFIPGHACIDNAIHLKAGLGLRMACHKHMRDQGHDEPRGRAFLTPGYNLYASHVIHTVGPNCHDGLSLSQAKNLLKSSYLSVLNLAQEKNIKSLVFCSISTGVYGMPIEVASELALKTINDYLKVKKGFDKIIMNVFSQEDYHVYKKQGKKLFMS